MLTYAYKCPFSCCLLQCTACNHYLVIRNIHVLFFESVVKYDLPSDIMKYAVQKDFYVHASNNSPTVALYLARSVCASLCRRTTPLTRQFPIIEARHSSRGVSFTVPWTPPAAPSLCQHVATHSLVSALISDNFLFIYRIGPLFNSCCSDTLPLLFFSDLLKLWSLYGVSLK